MSRYIDADALFAEFENADWYNNADRDEVAERLVLQAPTIDAVSVVRCQDCKYWVYNFNGCSRNPCTEPWYATDFCNYGERKESE